ncbi:hypothetical protein D3OALGA1CA_814 [Olavius algarvensis associated proteobacterium Delta 3]|nr:hypothetical protein D3OALGA1CA_814 [Olavius algarvensis associated proteobacterium Delta 3]
MIYRRAAEGAKFIVFLLFAALREPPFGYAQDKQDIEGKT